jgi:hypothetical protein
VSCPKIADEPATRIAKAAEYRAEPEDVDDPALIAPILTEAVNPPKATDDPAACVATLAEYCEEAEIADEPALLAAASTGAVG